MPYVISPDMVQYLPHNIIPIAVQNFTADVGAGGYDYPKFPILYPPRRNFKGEAFEKHYFDILKKYSENMVYRALRTLACNAYTRSYCRFDYDNVPTFALVSRHVLQRRLLAKWLSVPEVGKEMIEKWIANR